MPSVPVVVCSGFTIPEGAEPSAAYRQFFHQMIEALEGVTVPADVFLAVVASFVVSMIKVHPSSEEMLEQHFRYHFEGLLAARRSMSS